MYIKDSHLTGRPDVGKVEFPLSKLRANECLSVWLPVLPVNPNQQAQGELYLDLTYRVRTASWMDIMNLHALHLALQTIVIFVFELF